MDFDEIIKCLGDFGLYQKRLYFSICFIAIFTAIQVMLTVFSFGIPDHRCAIPGVENDTYASISQNESLGFVYENKIYQQCYISVIQSNNDTSPNATQCERWVYDKSVFQTTIVSEMDIVCEQKIGKSHAQMLLMLGQVTGCALVGPLSDMFGRKTMMCVFIIIHIVSSISITWTSPLKVTLAFYFFLGTSLSGCFTPAFVLAVELVGPKMRVYAGMIIEFFWLSGNIILSGAAYWIRNWQHLQLAMAVPSLCLLLYFCADDVSTTHAKLGLMVAAYTSATVVFLNRFVNESPRWLLNKGRIKEAVKIIRHAAKVNKVVLPERLFSRNRRSTEASRDMSITKVFTSKILLSRTLIIYIIWASTSLTFFGLSLNAGNLSGSIYLNFFLLSIIELPGYIACILLLDRVGRRILLCSSLLQSGICLILSIFTVLYASESLSWMTTFLAVFGKLGVTAAFAIVWIYTTELFPTVLRNSGVGSSSLMARIAAAISPYVANLGLFIPGTFGKVTPLIIFGVASLTAGILALFLPETKGRKMPETIEDAENFSRKSNDKPHDTWEELKVLNAL